METSDHTDRERRRVKQRERQKLRLKARTLRVLVAIAPLLTKLVQLGIVAIDIFRR